MLQSRALGQPVLFFLTHMNLYLVDRYLEYSQMIFACGMPHHVSFLVNTSCAELQVMNSCEELLILNY